LFEGSGIHKWGFGQPEYEPGEHLLVKLPFMAQRTIPREADRLAISKGEFRDSPSPFSQHTQGRLYVTDRRARLIGNHHKLLREWRWDQLRDVQVIRGWGGLRFIVDIQDTSDDASVRYYNPLIAFPFNGPRSTDARKQLRAEASFILGTGRDYESWLSRLIDRYR
jgi:hypothetical protein